MKALKLWKNFLEFFRELFIGESPTEKFFVREDVDEFKEFWRLVKKQAKKQKKGTRLLSQKERSQEAD